MQAFIIILGFLINLTLASPMIDPRDVVRDLCFYNETSRLYDVNFSLTDMSRWSPML